MTIGLKGDELWQNQTGCYALFVITKQEQKYIDLLIDQRNWLNANRNQLRNRAKKLYQNYKDNKLPKNIMSRCCDFVLLEEKCKEYK